MVKIRRLVLPLIFLFPGALCAESVPNNSALDVIKLIDDMEELYRGDASKAEITMRVETPYYKRSMKMESINLGTEKSFIRILSPKKERGVSTLKIDKEMWNYLPKINKVIKVPPSLMMGSWTDVRDWLASVKSVPGEMAIAPAGSVRLRSRSASSVASGIIDGATD